MRHTMAWVLAGLMLSSTSLSQANDTETCPPHRERTDKYRHLRALSLDLRGVPPTPEEYEALQEHDDVPEAWIDAWMKTPEFAARVVRWHRDSLWNNVLGEKFIADQRVLRSTSEDHDSGIYWRRNLAARLRGSEVPCNDEQAKLTDGTLVEHPSDLSRGELQRTEGIEGWVLVKPYWAPEKHVKICALDAREDAVSKSGATCNTNPSDLGCGCGPNLIWCAPPAVNNRILLSFNEQIDRLVSWIIEERRPYTDLFTTQNILINGPLACYWRHLYALGHRNIQNEPNPTDVEQLPNLDFTQIDTWEWAAAGEHHAGVLTSPGYLLRFLTNRARANQFYTKFRCQPFQPPEQGLALEGQEHPDLQQREGCKYCHAQLEPAAAYWGRWREDSAGYLHASEFPVQSAECTTCAKTGRNCSTECINHYITKTPDPAMLPYAGYLNAYIFRAREHGVNVEQGPRLLAMTSIADNTLLSCVAQRSAERLLGRALQPQENTWLEELVQTFSATNHDYPSVLKQIVMSEAYRSVR